MKRRAFVAGLASALAVPSLACAQTVARTPTLGLLYPNPSVTPQGTALDFFSAWLKQLGWSVGGNLAVENASGEGREDRLSSLAAALVEKRVDVIWAAGPEAALAAARATQTIPIAFYGVGFPVEQGLVNSLSRPGRNVTGLASFAGSERAKGVELLREIAPSPKRLSWIQVDTVAQTLKGDKVRVEGQNVADVALRTGFEGQIWRGRSFS